MSLIITSNDRSNRPNTAEAFKPYSYQNHLLNTMKIPPNSEIALQSAKIQKRGTVLVNAFNNQFFHYFGAPIGTATHPDLTYATSLPMWGMTGDPRTFVDDGEHKEFNTDDFAEQIEKGMDFASFHPSLIRGIAADNSPTSGVDVSVNQSAASSFQGYKWEITQSSTKVLENTTFNFKDISQRRIGDYSIVGGAVSATTRNGFFVQDRRRPLAQDAGECIFDVNLANGAGTKPWAVGLSRINSDRYDDGEVWNAPEYFNPNYGHPQVFNRASGKTYYDICVARVGTELRVYQACINNDYAEPASHVRAGRRGANDLLMKEVEYWGAFNMNFATPATATTYSKIKFILQNEEWEIFVYDGMGWTRLADFTVNKGGGGGKKNVIYANNQCKWAVYPTMSLSNQIGGTLEVESYQHYTDYPLFSDEYSKYWDYWMSLQHKGLTRWGQLLESQFWNDFYDETSGLAGDGLLTPLKLNAGGGMDAYENILITAPSIEYDRELTGSANSSQILGMWGRSVARPLAADIANLVISLTSSETPDLKSGTSLFIRLNNFTQMSVNARKGTISKILAHLPRFDNAGNEAGALYYEPHEKTYIALNNTEELTINSFDLDIVYDDERLCTAVSGKTIICLHLRQRNLKSD